MAMLGADQRASSIDSPLESQKASVHISKIVGVRLPQRDPNALWDVSLSNGVVESVRPHEHDSSGVSNALDVLNAHSRLLAPSLCHAHIHLDKCFLLQDPKYADLQIVKGDFDEAMSLTSKAKRRFEEEDLLRRGRRLIEESIHFGVTHMRAFVELDADVDTKCLDAGLRLKREFQSRCEVQICAFAQLPVFSGPDGGQAVRSLMSEAVLRDGVDAVGSTPYVEADNTRMQKNLQWIVELAMKQGKHLDLHMDYHLDRTKEPLIFEALSILHKQKWPSLEGRHITMGHCTRLTCFEGNEPWKELRDTIGLLPISFVGLPTSDLFMMRTDSGVRGTLNIPEMIQRHELDAAVAVNNIGNAFTPQGSCDPLALASLCVGVYQAGTIKDAELLYGCVSERAKSAIALPPTSLNIAPGEPANFVIFDKCEPDWHTRKSIAEVVYDAGGPRITLKDGHLVTERR